MLNEALQKLSPTTAYEKTILEPPLSAWPSAQSLLADAELQILRSDARRRLLQTSTQYRQKLVTIAQQAGLLSEDTSAGIQTSNSQPLVMTGHQPVIFHPGLKFKYEATEQFASKHGAVPVAVIIDSDDGDAGAFSFPHAVPGSTPAIGPSGEQWPQLTTVNASFAQGSSLYGSGRRKSPDEIRAEALRASTGLLSAGCPQAAEALQNIAGQYAALTTDSMLEANLIVRWQANIGRRMLEIPLSAICSFPEVTRFFSGIMARPFEFAECYNTTLASFRTEQKIRNEANPFPSLQYEEQRCELPFWILDPAEGTRSVVAIRKQGLERTLETAEGLRVEILPGNEAASILSLLIAGKQLIPRGALITAMLRMLFSDLFVHGTGGGRYDRYTDLLIRSWWKVEPAPFAVASASQYLFETQRRELTRLQHIAEQLRDLQFNPQRHFGEGFFTPSMEDRLRTRLQAKENAVNRLKQAREAGQSAQEIGREIQQHGDEIKAMVAQEFEPCLSRLRVVSSETMAAWNNRTWPWMFF